jgi:hypothetical protein
MRVSGPFFYGFFLLSVFGAIVPAAQAQEDDSAAENGDDQTPVKKKKKKKKKPSKAGHQPAEEAPESAPPSQPATKSASQAAHAGAWFPDWPADRFDWVFQPIFAFKYTQGVNEQTGTTRTSTAEGGLAAGLVGVPVVPGNPGLTTGPRVGVAYGYSNSLVKDKAGETTDSSFHYRRQWGGIDNAFYFKSFRYGLSLTRGMLKVIEDEDRLIQSFRADNDFGVIFRTWLSGHYSLLHGRAYHRKFSKPFLVENDHWLHARILTGFLDFLFDFGPGVTAVSAWSFDGENSAGGGTVSYFLLKTRFTVLWKLIGEGIGKYAIDASEKRLGRYATERLPEDDLNEPATLAMPEDSFLGSLFFGIKDLAFGIGAGWRYNIQVLNVAEKDGTSRETTKNHGLGLYYEVRL